MWFFFWPYLIVSLAIFLVFKLHQLWTEQRQTLSDQMFLFLFEYLSRILTFLFTFRRVGFRQFYNFIGHVSYIYSEVIWYWKHQKQLYIALVQGVARRAKNLWCISQTLAGCFIFAWNMSFCTCFIYCTQFEDFCPSKNCPSVSTLKHWIFHLCCTAK